MQESPISRRSEATVVAAVACLFLSYSALHAPVPGAGEPHYLAKARHFYDPSWCEGDFFLESPSAHAVFYAAIGWLTLLLPFEAVAVIGRCAALTGVAVGWSMLVRRLVHGAGSPLLAAAVYILFAAIGNLSGEWLLDGVEGKVPAYALLFAGWAALLDRRGNTAALLLGTSISFHPIVGGWGLIAGLAGILWRRLRPTPSGTPPRPTSLRSLVSPAVLLMLAAAPGVISAASALSGGNSRTADYIQVFYRLAHHLDPTTITSAAAIAYAGLLVIWLWLRRWESVSDAQRWWTGCVLAAVLIGVAGLVVGRGPRPPEGMQWLSLRMRLMKFYPFRLVDLLLPIAVAISAAHWAARWMQATTSPDAAKRRWWIVAAVFGLIAVGGLWRTQATRFQPPVPESRRAAWRDACWWIRDNAPKSSVFLTPHETWAFKWFAQRPEYVAYKDCPQDAAGIIEWNRRLRTLRRWSEEEWNDGFTVEAMRSLSEQTGITHILARDLGPFPVPPVYNNGEYRVYAIPIPSSGASKGSGAKRSK